MRVLNQTLMLKKNELTQVYQGQARTTTELASMCKDLRGVGAERQRLEKGQDAGQARILAAESPAAALTERLRVAVGILVEQLQASEAV
jgi:hypothetical protein